MIRKEPLINGEIYHIINRSIAGFKIFNNDIDFQRIYNLLWFCQSSSIKMKYSYYTTLPTPVRNQIRTSISTGINDYLVNIIAYCIMPTHIHFVLKQLKDNGITAYMTKMLNGYAKYFNTNYKRSGHLFEGKFRNVRIKDDNQLLHLTRYVHLNPTSAELVKKPEDWKFSSYNEYIGNIKPSARICKWEDIIDISPQDYKKFSEERISYQKELSILKSLLLENYTG